MVPAERTLGSVEALAEADSDRRPIAEAPRKQSQLTTHPRKLKPWSRKQCQKIRRELYRDSCHHSCVAGGYDKTLLVKSTALLLKSLILYLQVKAEKMFNIGKSLTIP